MTATFAGPLPGVTLDQLAAIVAERAAGGGPPSYTRSLLDKGIAKCAQKLGEEAVETVIAAVSGPDEAVVAEVADLLYHLLVVLEARGIKLAAVQAELGRRTGRTGLEEKAARTA
ncbi:MAG TPA: phosphoribosyl-ATP diphosphatase [Xanthobacteraceae bacterium]|nr:phosphoribosyl-ATP diphosphatase [Xanthobacteraceae bacterium]